MYNDVYTNVHCIVTWLGISLESTVLPLLVATQERPPSLIRPQIFVTTTINVFILPLTKGHLSNVATISWQIW